MAKCLKFSLQSKLKKDRIIKKPWQDFRNGQINKDIVKVLTGEIQKQAWSLKVVPLLPPATTPARNIVLFSFLQASRI